MKPDQRSRVRRRWFWYHKFEFLYFRLVRHFVRLKNPRDFFKKHYILHERLASNLLFEELFYFDPLTDIGDQLFFIGAFEKAEIEVCNQLISAPFVVMDIGGNIGYHSVHFAKLAVNGNVIVFEPSADTRKILEQNVRPYSNVKIESLALSSTEGEAIFNIASDNAYSGLKDTKVKTIIRTEMVRTTTLDAYVLDNNLDKIDFIKIDVEGFEFFVLQGMEVTLKKLRPTLFLEISSNLNQSKESLLSFELLRNAGYRAHIISNGDLTPIDTLSTKTHNYFFIPEEKDGLHPHG
ncbi:MAG: FkbM family methyltransferase [Flavobacteriales bacterium]